MHWVFITLLSSVIAPFCRGEKERHGAGVGVFSEDQSPSELGWAAAFESLVPSSQGLALFLDPCYYQGGDCMLFFCGFMLWQLPSGWSRSLRAQPRAVSGGGFF